jgi:hypothetical protein
LLGGIGGTNLLQDEIYAFIVRVWYETFEQQGDSGEWRGSIEQVDAGERLYFRDLALVPRFIRKRLGIRSNGLARRWHALCAALQRLR